MPLKLLVDKPGGITHEYRGEQIRIAFRYSNDSDIPTGVVISPEVQPAPNLTGKSELVVYDLFEGNWNSYWEAVDAGIERAEAFVDAHWEEP